MTYAFTDGSPLYEFGIFLALVLFCVVVARQSAVARAIDRAIPSLASALQCRGVIAVLDVCTEQRRLDLLRIVLCAFAAVGAGRNVAAALLAEDVGLAAIQAVACLLATLGAVGFATPVVLALLAVSLNPILDNLSYSSSLPSMVLAMFLVALAVAPAGPSRAALALRSRLRCEHSP